MTYREILQWPAPELSKISSPVTDFECKKFKKLVIDLIDTCNVELGAGLAANQIGVLKRVLVLKPEVFGVTDFNGSDYNKKFLIMVNPVLEPGKEKKKWKEGCLSFREYSGLVERAERVKVSFENEKGEKQVLEAQWPFSAGVQHECDHLDGITFEKRMGSLARSRLTGKILKKKKAEVRKKKKLEKERKNAADSSGSFRKGRKLRKRIH